MWNNALILFVVAFAFLALAIILFRSKPPLASGTGIGALGALLLAIVLAVRGGIVWIRHAHKPVNVSDINQMGDAEPGACAADDTYVYFAALGTLLVNGQHSSEPAYKVFKCDVTQLAYDPPAPRNNRGITALDDTTFPVKPSALAVIPGTAGVMVASNNQLWVLNNRATVAAPQGTAAPSQILGLRANLLGAVMLGVSGARTVQIYSVDPGSASYRAVPQATVSADTITALEVSTILPVAFIAQTGASAALWTWTSGRPNPVNVAEPRLLGGNGTAFYVVGTDQGHPRAFRLGSGLEALRDPSTGPLDQIFGVAQWSTSEWVLGSQRKRLLLWRVSNNMLVEEKDIGSASVETRPRSFIPLGDSLGFISQDNWFWNVSPDHRYAAQPLDGDPAFVVTEMFPHQRMAVFAGRFVNQDPTQTTGNELGLWWSDH